MAFLMGRSGPVQDRRYEIEKDTMSIGRRSENELVIDDTSVSGRHAVILREGDRYRLRDLDSTNGTLVNGAPVREMLLNPNDTITLGDVQFEFDDPAWTNAAAEAVKANLPTPAVGTMISTQKIPSSFQTSSPFGARRDFSNVWISVIALAAILAAATAVVFIVRFFNG